jgi:hypothetical protein
MPYFCLQCYEAVHNPREEAMVQKIWKEGDRREAFFLASFTLPLETGWRYMPLVLPLNMVDKSTSPFTDPLRASFL